LFKALYEVSSKHTLKLHGRGNHSKAMGMMWSCLKRV